MTQINQRMATGIVWMIGARMLDRSIGVLSTLILARLLVPDDFGLVAMATAIIGMLDLLSSFSFDLALIQKQNAERRHFDTVWTFNVLFGMFGALALLLLAAPAARFYSEPRLASVMQVLALSYVINGFSNVGLVTFRKELQFRQEFIFICARRLVTFIITIGAAVLLRSYWALLLGMTVGRLVNLAMSYAMNSYRPRLTLSAASELFHFSKWMLLNNVLGFLRHDGCTFIIGKAFGATTLGIYAVSYEISNLPSTELVAPINRVSFPGFAKLAERALIASSYFRLLSMITLMILPVGIGIAAVATPLVLAMLGEKWVQAIPLVAVLAVSGAITATQTNNASVWLALGQPQKVTLIQVCYLAILFPALYYCVHRFGLVGAGYAYLLAQSIDVLVSMSVTRHMLGFRWGEAIAVVWRPVLGVCGMYAGVTLLDGTLLHSAPLLRLLIDAALGALLYGAIVLALWWACGRPEGAEAFCLRQVQQRLAVARRIQP